ncbi:MAG: hypothetical protein PHG82_01560 [Candidatus Gracilibacteria bacterium]|nr:hypothetical protein [Candidatus Gracilibacteria bacterium]
MIYLFTGNSSYLIEKKVQSWKKAFIDKFGDFNLLHIRDLSQISQDFLRENLLSSPFLGDKKVIIIEDFFKKAKAKKDDEEDNNDDTNTSNLNDFLLNIFPRIPENNIVVLTSTNILKASKIYKFIKEHGKIEEFDIKDDIDLKDNLQKIYPNSIDSRALDLIISYKAGDIYKIVNEIDKLHITNDFIDSKIIENFVIPELEQNIFPLLDDFLNLKKNQFFSKLDTILQRNSYFQFYWSFLSNLRFYVYVYKLKSDSYTSRKIVEDLGLGNRGFLVDKNYAVSAEKLFKVFEDIVELDLQMKSGDFVGSAEEDFKFELEKVLLNYFA